MTDIAIQEKHLIDIANAIRINNGTTQTYKPNEMATAINDLTLTQSPSTLDIEAYFAGTMTELSSDTITRVGPLAFAYSMTSTTPGAASADALRTVNLPNATYLDELAFSAWSEVDTFTVNIPNVVYIGSSCFSGREGLRKIDLPKVVYIGDRAFFELERLSTVILRADTKCELGGTEVFFSTDNSATCPFEKGTGVVYVPSSLLAEYEADSTWRSAIGNSVFKPLEEYTG